MEWESSIIPQMYNELLLLLTPHEIISVSTGVSIAEFFLNELLWRRIRYTCICPSSALSKTAYLWSLFVWGASGEEGNEPHTLLPLCLPFAKRTMLFFCSRRESADRDGGCKALGLPRPEKALRTQQWRNQAFPFGVFLILSGFDSLQWQWTQ